ncbi:hypothetical protein HN385_05000 [archaeon]|jgi:uncharacterized membrane protein YraQ (UPF0718 family)|nr:hypothetical protein [archaeon]MBT3465053.1 hypothetical protein [archaeon]MBT6869274.1 hypothetical protein [archaeon]MBT7193672.1 hypothetical protein [archaeon]MBT7381216.1 hypothetical protein [archaeon]
MGKFNESIIKSLKSLWNAFPILIGIILLISLINVLIPKSTYSLIFTGNYITDSFVGGILGSILAGNPITSYIIGGELLNEGISLIAITAFLVCWVTVGLIQLPAEITILGKKFAIIRNLISFIFSIVIAIITTMVVNLI